MQHKQITLVIANDEFDFFDGQRFAKTHLVRTEYDIGLQLDLTLEHLPKAAGQSVSLELSKEDDKANSG